MLTTAIARLRMLFVSSMGTSEGQIVSKERMAEMWHMLARGDDQVFTREFLLLDEEIYGGYEALFYKTEIRQRHTKNFIKTFDRLMVMAKNCDSGNDIIADTLSQTSHGLIYNRMREAQPDELKIECMPVDSEDYEKVLEQSQE